MSWHNDYITSRCPDWEVIHPSRNHRHKPTIKHSAAITLTIIRKTVTDNNAVIAGSCPKVERHRRSQVTIDH